MEEYWKREKHASGTGALRMNRTDKGIWKNKWKRMQGRPDEPECSRFIAGVRSAMAELDGSIHRKLALARAEKNVVLGHDMSGRERL